MLRLSAKVSASFLAPRRCTRMARSSTLQCQCCGGVDGRWRCWMENGHTIAAGHGPFPGCRQTAACRAVGSGGDAVAMDDCQMEVDTAALAPQGRDCETCHVQPRGGRHTRTWNFVAAEHTLSHHVKLTNVRTVRKGCTQPQCQVPTFRAAWHGAIDICLHLSRAMVFCATLKEWSEPFGVAKHLRKEVAGTCTLLNIRLLTTSLTEKEIRVVTLRCFRSLLVHGNFHDPERANTQIMNTFRVRVEMSHMSRRCTPRTASYVTVESGMRPVWCPYAGDVRASRE